MEESEKTYEHVRPSRILERIDTLRRQNKTAEYVARLGREMDLDHIPVSATFDLTGTGDQLVPYEFQFSELVSFDKSALALFKKLEIDPNRLDNWRLVIACLAALLLTKGRQINEFDQDFLRLAIKLKTDHPNGSHSELARAINVYAKKELQRLYRDTEADTFTFEDGRIADKEAAKKFLNKLTGHDNVRLLLRGLNDKKRNEWRRRWEEVFKRCNDIAIFKGVPKEVAEEFLQELIEWQDASKAV